MQTAADHHLNPQDFYGHPLKFNPKQHRYEWQGKLVPGVTSILRRLAKPALIQWSADMACQWIAANCPEADGHWTVSAGDLEEARRAHATIRDAAGVVGKDAHSYAEAVMKGEDIALPEDKATRSAIEAFIDWHASHEIEPIALERRVFSKRFYYAGTADFFGYIDGALSVLDFKTSSAIYDEMWLQTSAYELALREQLDIGPATEIRRWIVRLDKKTGKFEAIPQGHSSAHEDAWLHLVELNKVLSRMEAARKEENGISRARQRPRQRAS